MAEYIDRNLIEWYGCNFETPSCQNRECSGCRHAECSHTQVMQIPPSDVIERSEYEFLKKENKELAIKYDNAMNMVINGNEQLEKLRSKIDKAILEIESEEVEVDYMDERKSGFNSGLFRALEILKRNIGE